MFLPEEELLALSKFLNRVNYSSQMQKVTIGWIVSLILLKTGSVGLIFLLPGIDETLRINGSAYITTDSSILDYFKDEDKTPISCLVISIDELFLHCAKALMRSKLWKGNYQIDPKDFPSIGTMLKDQLKSPEPAETREDMIKRYQKDL